MAEGKAQNQKILFIIDFDNTLIAKNTDREIIDAQSILGKCVSAKNYALNTQGWAETMTQALFELHGNEIYKEEIDRIILDIPLIDGMQMFFNHLRSYEGEKEVVLLSHSNSYFIDLLLDKYKLKDLFDIIYTYDSEWMDASGPLQVKPHDVPHTNCNICPIDFCKGVCVETHLEKRPWEGDFEYSEVFYIGDGSADFCGSLQLREQDHVFARKDFSMHHRLVKDDGKKMKPTWSTWETGEDIVHTLKRKSFQK